MKTRKWYAGSLTLREFYVHDHVVGKLWAWTWKTVGAMAGVIAPIVGSFTSRDEGSDYDYN